ncbi:recombinase family protein [Chitinibacter bivalviorum]|uniref:Recombinase family protein n=1 Tax=Chitinibacter bivalviorum TaxID=2739434 RepID=A0A7H9BJA6_9NEIS|nr:recombinase family protein [Chitinibacter bivalviorum]QLG87634.1 recombinase family protein [Chitinibacter bivalviorum]
MFVRAYLRASTKEQDASRAKRQLDAFAANHDLRIASYYVENESGTKLDRPELMRLLSDASHSDVLLVEQVDRLSRLKNDDWLKLRRLIAEKGVRIVALDLPTSHTMLKDGDGFTALMLAAINNMLLDMLAAIARKDYDDRRRRQAEGVAKAKVQGLYKGRPKDIDLHRKITSLLAEGKSWNAIQDLLGCGRATIKRVKDEAVRVNIQN